MLAGAQLAKITIIGVADHLYHLAMKDNCLLLHQFPCATLHTLQYSICNEILSISESGNLTCNLSFYKFQYTSFNIRNTPKLPFRALNKKSSFQLRISSVNVMKSARNCGFGHIC